MIDPSILSCFSLRLASIFPTLMNINKRAAKKAMSISIDDELREQMEDRAKILGFDRSSYIRFCIRKEIGLEAKDAKQNNFRFAPKQQA